MNNLTPRYWFRAKTYGWGWRLPTAWQGWVAAGVWLLAIIGVGIWLAPRSLPLYLAATAALSVAMIGVCWIKGEPPRWR